VNLFLRLRLPPVSFPLTLFPRAHIQPLQMLSQRVPHKCRTIPFRSSSRLIRSLQQFFIEHNLDSLHVWTPFHGLLHTEDNPVMPPPDMAALTGAAPCPELCSRFTLRAGFRLVLICTRELPMNRIALIAALPSELKPLTHHWTRNGPLRTGRLGSMEAVAACAGMGEKAVTRACEAALAAGPLDAIVSVGYAGSLSCGLRAPDAVAVREVVDDRTGEHFPADHFPSLTAAQSDSQLQPQRLVTLDHVANPEEKRRLAATHQATLVDMEASTVARFARDHNLGFLCFKAVTDGPNDELPDFNRFTTPQGQLRMAAFAAWVVWHPRYWRVLADLEKSSHAASHQLAALLQAISSSPSASSSVI